MVNKGVAVSLDRLDIIIAGFFSNIRFVLIVPLDKSVEILGCLTECGQASIIKPVEVPLVPSEIIIAKHHIKDSAGSIALVQRSWFVDILVKAVFAIFRIPEG